MPQPDADRTLRVGETDTVGVQFHGSDLPDDVTVSSATVAVDPGAATDSDGSLCVYDGGGTTAIVKNRLGAVGEIRIVYYYN